MTSIVESWLGLSIWEKSTVISFSLSSSWKEEHQNMNHWQTLWWFSRWGAFHTSTVFHAQFPSISIKGDLLFDPFWEAVSRLERCDLKVLALICDGASVNRRLFKLHQTGKEFVHKVINPFAMKERFLYFFFDPPHRLKTVRNSWQNRKRHLWVSVLCSLIV